MQHTSGKGGEHKVSHVYLLQQSAARLVLHLLECLCLSARMFTLRDWAPAPLVLLQSNEHFSLPCTCCNARVQALTRQTSGLSYGAMLLSHACARVPGGPLPNTGIAQQSP